MQNVGEQLGIGNLEDFRPHPSLVTPDAVGVELELEGFTGSDIERASRHLHPLWTATTDGSLRNGGVELITNGGLGGEQLYAAFERVISLLERQNYDASWRCSTHMHLNMRDFTVNQVARFMMVYAACEPVLFAHCGKFRYSSNFCVPIAESLPFHKKLISRLFDNAVATRAAAAMTVKYTAMNFQPLFGDGRRPALGTVEFRGGRPLTTLDEFILQTNLLLSIKEYVRQHTNEPEGDMLTHLGEGVMNTVYANGCAAALEAPQSSLDEGILHAWMLLKAYQKGMKSPAPSSRPWREAASAQLAAAAMESLRESGSPAAGRLTLEQIRAAGYWNPGHCMVTDPIHRELASSAHRRFRQARDALNDPHVSRHSKMVELALCLRNGLQVTESGAASAAAYWAMLDCDRARRMAQRIPASNVYLEACRQVASGRPIWVYNGKPYESQPGFTWGQARFEYGDVLTEEQKARITTLLFQNSFSTMYTFDAILQRRVRVKAWNVLNSRLQALGIEASVDDNGTLQVAILMWLLAITDSSSIDHVHSRDLESFTRIHIVVDTLLSANLSVPFYKDYTRNAFPGGIIRCETSLRVPMGHGVGRETVDRIFQGAQRPARTTVYGSTVF